MNKIIEAITKAFSVSASERSMMDTVIIIIVLIVIALALYVVFLMMLHLTKKDLKEEINDSGQDQEE